jgi:hypothetical protein
MASIFISYRRVGALVHARALFERLRHEFGPNEVFIDLEGVDYGLDFVDILNEQLNGCQVMLALIDPQWATATDRQGRRRIDRENDYVRTEITTALARGIRTVPILIDGAEMPDSSDLPEPLRPLVRRNALILDFNRFDAEVSRLIGVIRKLLSSSSLGVHLEPDLLKRQDPELHQRGPDASQQDQKERRQAGQSGEHPAQQSESRPTLEEPRVAATFSLSAAGPSLPPPNRFAGVKRYAAIVIGVLLLGGSLLFFLARWPNGDKLPPTTPGVVKLMEPDFVVGQYFGEPLILATLRVENPGASTINITNIRGTLTEKEHSFTVAPVSWTIIGPYGPFAQITGPIAIFAGAKMDLRVVMITGANFPALYTKTSALPEYKTQMPCVPTSNGTPNPMTAAGFQVAKEFAEQHFGWYAGDWTMRLDVSTENDSKSFTRSFSLSPSEIDHLRGSIILIKQCLTVNLASPLAQDSTVSNFLTK